MLIFLRVDGDAKEKRVFFKRMSGVILPVSIFCYSADADMILQVENNSAKEVMHHLRGMEKKKELKIVSSC